MSTIEFSLIEVSVLHGLKQGNEVLKEIHKEMNLETVEKLLEEPQEARAYQKASGLSLAVRDPGFRADHTRLLAYRKSARCSRTRQM